MKRLTVAAICMAFMAMTGCVSMFPSSIEEETDQTGYESVQEGEGGETGTGSGTSSGTGTTTGSATGSASTTSGSSSSGQYLSATFDYCAYSDSIHIATNQNYCYGNTLVKNVVVDVAYTINGDKLWLTGLSATGPLQEHLLIEDKEAVVFIRNGSGYGLDGEWTLYAARDARGNLHTPSELLGTQTVQFKDSTLYIRVSKPKAELELAILARVASLDPNLSVDIISGSQLRFYGRKTNETVNVYFNGYTSAQYISSNPNHHTHTFYANPTSCPNDPAPGWFYDFIKDNSGLIKRKA
jgi:hypothetical protein